MADILFQINMLFLGPFPLYIIALVSLFFLWQSSTGSNALKNKDDVDSTAAKTWWKKWEWIFQAAASVLALIAAFIGLIK